MSELRPPEPDPRIVRWIVPALAVSFLLLGATGSLLYIHYGDLPERFPTHYGIDGKADAFRTKSAAVVALPLVMGALVIALMAAVLYGIAFGTRCTGTAGTLELRMGPRRFFAGVLTALTVALSLLFSYVSLLPIAAPGGPWVIVGCVIAVLFLAFWLAIRMAEESGGDETSGDRWTAGLFYYNPEDPALMVERRLGFGYTPNFARPLAWIVMGLAAVLGAAPFLLLSIG